MRSSRRIGLAAAACIAWCASPQIGLAAEKFHSNPRAGIDYYLQSHGRVDPTRVPDTYQVFTNVLRVADRSSTTVPQLVVVNDREQASAFVLADGTIYVSQKALDIIRANADETEATARLAFVLGHELAHIADNDFWDNEVSQALLDSSTARELHRVLNSGPAQQKKELKADDRGFLYAALAGYRVDRVVQPTAAGTDFLTFWIDQIGRQDDENYPSPAHRTELLRARLAERADAVQFFRFGTRLAYFGRYREALTLLREFQRQFPSREVFNDLGYVNLRLAIEQLPPEYAYHYWLPALADLSTPLARLSVRAADRQPRATWTVPAPARENLLEATRNFELAATKDPGYAPAQVNLAVTQLLLGMDSGLAPATAENHLLRARLAANAALTLTPADTGTRALLAIVDFEQQRARGSERGAVSPPIAESREPMVAYDLARLDTGGQRHWQQVLEQFDAVPSRIQNVICREPADVGAALAERFAERCSRLSASVRTTATLPWALPMQLSRDLLDRPVTDAETTRFGWKTTSLPNGKVYSNADASILALDDITTLAVLRSAALTSESLLQCCGQPRDRLPVVGGTLWHYGQWIAWLRDNKVQEIWVAN